MCSCYLRFAWRDERGYDGNGGGRGRIGHTGRQTPSFICSKNTALAEEYFKGKVQTLDMNAYIQLAADFLERIPSDITVQRLVGDTHGNFLISPIWKASKAGITAGITKELERRGSYQGSLYSESKKSLIVIRLHFPFKTYRNRVQKSRSCIP